jgi:Domain of unknown function (DUF4394)/Calx-beta domain
MELSWIRSALETASPRSCSVKRRRKCRPALEELEDRRVPTTAFGLTTSNGLFTFDTNTPSQTTQPLPITGLAANEQLEGIDIRPADGKLYGLGLVPNTTTLRLYVINTQTGAATQVGNAPLLLDTAKVTNPSDLGTAFGLDFNPQADKLRVVTNTGRNFRVDPATGMTVDADPVAAGVQFDTDINPAGQAIVSLAYTNDTPGATSTTLFGYNFAGDQLVRVGGQDGNPSPNTGTTTVIGSSGIFADFAGVANQGFDIQGTDSAFANVLVNGVENLYSVNLTNGMHTKVGAIGDGSNTTRDIALTLPGTPPPPLYQFSSPTVAFPENGGSATLTVIRTGDSSQAGSVTYTITGGTATAGLDYNLPMTGQVNFAANETTKNIIVPIIGAHRDHQILPGQRHGRGLGLSQRRHRDAEHPRRRPARAQPVQRATWHEHLVPGPGQLVVEEPGEGEVKADPAHLYRDQPHLVPRRHHQRAAQHPHPEGEEEGGRDPDVPGQPSGKRDGDLHLHLRSETDPAGDLQRPQGLTRRKAARRGFGPGGRPGPALVGKHSAKR